MSEDEAIRTAIALVTAARQGDDAAPQMAHDLTTNREDAFAVMAVLLAMLTASMSEADVRMFALAASREAER